MNLKRFIIGVLAAAAMVMSSIAYAQDVQRPDFQQEEIVTVSKDTVINKDFFGAGEVIEIDGTINGDVYVAGGDVTINGVVNGDVLAAGGSVTIAQGAIVTQNIRAAGGRILINGSVDRNVSAVGGSITLSAQALPKGNVIIAGGEAIIDAPITKDLKVAAGSLKLNNTVGGDADIAIGQIQTNDAARINGNLTYISEQEQTLREGLVVGTSMHYFPPQNNKNYNQQDVRNILSRTFLFMGIFSLISKLLIGLLFIHILPSFSEKAAANLRSTPWKSLGTGFLVVVLTPILIMALFFTLIGIPIAFMFIFAYVLLLYLSPIIVMLALGHVIASRLQQKWNDATAFIIGLMIIAILRFIPFVNFFSTLFVTMWGVGVLMNTKLEMYKDFRKKKLL